MPHISIKDLHNVYCVIDLAKATGISNETLRHRILTGKLDAPTFMVDGGKRKYYTHEHFARLVSVLRNDPLAQRVAGK